MAPKTSKRTEVKKEGKAKNKTSKKNKPAWLKKRTGGIKGKKSKPKVNIKASEWRVPLSLLKTEKTGPCDHGTAIKSGAIAGKMSIPGGRAKKMPIKKKMYPKKATGKQ